MNREIANWLVQFEAAPVEAFHELVLGRTAVPAWTRCSLREIFIEIWQTHREVLDKAVTAWLSPRIFQPVPERTPEQVWASQLQDVFRAVAGVPLATVQRLLRERVRDFRSWLRPFRYAESCDPEAAFLAALAWATTNQGLEGMWQSLAVRKEREPLYYTDLGLLGLCKARDAQSNLPPKATFLLRATLLDLADAGMSRDDWELTTRALLASYPLSAETWVREFGPVLEARPNAQNGPKWLRRILPMPAIQQASDQQVAHNVPPAHTRDEKEAMIAKVANHGPAPVGPTLDIFLEKERAYANLTSNPHYLVRTFNRLAEAARYHDSNWAIDRAEEALAWDEDNARNWTVLARCLWAGGRLLHQSGDTEAARADCREAIDTLWKARFRFSYDAFVSTELAKMLRASGDLTTAEAIHREAIAEFPRNPWCLAGLADLLLQRSEQTGNQAERVEAGTLFQRAAELGDDYARRRLQNIDRHDGEMVEGFDLRAPSLAEMRPVQRLGRALLFQWQAVHTRMSGERESLFAQAETLLALPDSSSGDCRAAFIEARGFLLLARNRAADAKIYFERQLAASEPRLPLGLRLGLAEARARLGEPLHDLEAVELESFGRAGSILPLILKVLRLLQIGNSDDVLRATLMQLYPEVQRLLGLPASELGDEEEPSGQGSGPAKPIQQPAETMPILSGSYREWLAPVRPIPQTADTMLAQLVAVNIFQAAGINSIETFQSNESLAQVRSATRNSRDLIFSATEKIALAA
jgi:tetratricopeptide (TPR) repeat protein